ncbi:hypothetical protein DH2020_006166 [Rehmannia glutinosa]|uniref:Uncharacterized protein n=1 Tax=Rehmannia glutinosa TaxID=99300 RepID=A0ABR0XI47_REHGL
MLEKMEEKLDPEAVIEEFEALSRDAGSVQKQTLKKILEENGGTEYLLRWGLNGRTDPHSFKACVPLVSHNDLEPYIQRIADGKTPSALTAKPITTISLSSGTTHGKPKFVPFNDELMESTMQIYKTSFAFRNRRRAAVPTSDIRTRFSPIAILSSFMWTNFPRPSPSCFVHALPIASCTPSGRSNKFGKNFVIDIREGSLSSRITVPSIDGYNETARANPELADIIYNKCLGLSNWYGLIEELFPNTKYVYGIMTGSMEPYLKKLRHYAGGLPLLSAIMDLRKDGLEQMLTLNYHRTGHICGASEYRLFQFIPLKEDANGELSVEPQPVGLTEVKIDEEYEIIVTNFAGLYRYRLGDVVKVKGFHNSTPELQFICRRNLLLTVNIDKNTEKDLQLAVEAAAKLLAEEKLEVVDFTSHVDFSSEPGHYVVFWEIAATLKMRFYKNAATVWTDRSLMQAT